MKKIVKVAEKTYVIDEEGKTEEVESTEEEEVEGVEEEVEAEEEESKEEEEESEEDLEATVDETAQKIMASLGIEDLKKDIDDLKKLKSEKPVSALIDLETLMNKSIDKMTAKEKIVGFFQACIQNNTAVLKALSEGTNADGGYLVPDEFRAEIIRDIAESPHMRNEVTVVPMSRQVMNIPTLVEKPKVTWTDENATKSTTTAHFGQATLTAYKMAAILYSSDELIDDANDFDMVQIIVGLFA